MEGRYFRNLKYYYNGSFPYKKDAIARANRLRKEGNLARVVPYSQGWEVWDRRKIRR